MAYTPDTLMKVAQGVGSGGRSVWVYTTADSLATIAGAAYFSDGVAKGMKVGDPVLAVISNILKAGSVTALTTTAATFTVGAIT